MPSPKPSTNDQDVKAEAAFDAEAFADDEPRRGEVTAPSSPSTAHERPEGMIPARTRRLTKL
jgi:hypothetical protein